MSVERRSSSRLDWTEETVFHSGDSFFDEVLAAIDVAKRSIEVEVFIFRADQLGTRVCESLAKASRRGVRVRLLVDGIGSWRLSPKAIEALESAGVECRIYHPLPWQSQSGGLSLNLARLNRRNHRKLWIIDHETVFVGSMNVSEVHSESVMGAQAWRDIGVRLKGPPIVWLRAAFEGLWQRNVRARHWRKLLESASRSGLGRLGRELVEINQSYASRRRKNQKFIKRLADATQRVWLVNPYFVPSLSMLKALRRAAKRNVDVRILVPARSDLFFMPYIARKYFGWLLRNRIRIFEYQPSMLHAKIALVDDWVRIGSSNLNQRSLLHDLEVNVILRHKASIQSIEARVQEDFRRSSEVSLIQWKKRGWIHRGLELLVALFRRWL